MFPDSAAHAAFGDAALGSDGQMPNGRSMHNFTGLDRRLGGCEDVACAYREKSCCRPIVVIMWVVELGGTDSWTPSRSTRDSRRRVSWRPDPTAGLQPGDR
jgi:hypothetical protein